MKKWVKKKEICVNVQKMRCMWCIKFQFKLVCSWINHLSGFSSHAQIGLNWFFVLIGISIIIPFCREREKKEMRMRHLALAVYMYVCDSIVLCHTGKKKKKEQSRNAWLTKQSWKREKHHVKYFIRKTVECRMANEWATSADIRNRTITRANETIRLCDV